jgi:hypothetical protein
MIQNANRLSKRHMFPRIQSVRPLDGFRLELLFRDGVCSVVDLEQRIAGRGGLYRDLEDRAFFQQVRVEEETGTIVWPNGVDLCPDVLYTLAAGNSMEAKPGISTKS